MTKRYINPIDSPHLIKTIAITGDRLHKVVFRQKIPSTAVPLSEYTTSENKKNYPILREQIIKTLEIFKQASIDYGSLIPVGLLVNKESDGNIQILFYDYGQSIKPSDVEKSKFDEIKHKNPRNIVIHHLKSQFRVKGGLDYVAYLDKSN